MGQTLLPDRRKIRLRLLQLIAGQVLRSPAHGDIARRIEYPGNGETLGNVFFVIPAVQLVFQGCWHINIDHEEPASLFCCHERPLSLAPSLTTFSQEGEGCPVSDGDRQRDAKMSVVPWRSKARI